MIFISKGCADETPNFKAQLKEELKKDFPLIKPEVLNIILRLCAEAAQDAQQGQEVQRTLGNSSDLTPQEKRNICNKAYAQLCRSACKDHELVAKLERIILETKLKLARLHAPRTPIELPSSSNDPSPEILKIKP